MSREITLAIVQMGPADPDKDKNILRILGALDDVEQHQPDFVLFPELVTTQFFPVGLKKREFFDLAEPIPGPTTDLVGEKAREIGTYVLLPLFEKGPIEGQYYNSAAIIGPNGSVVPGILPSGQTVPCYRKNYISDYKWDSGENDEKFYFARGPGYPVFDTEKTRVGILVCYDRWFSEGYKILALRGAEIVFVPVASTGFVGDLFVAGLRTHAAENAIVVAGCNKGGLEIVEGREVMYYGLSCLVGTRGQVISQARQGEDDMVVATVDLDEIREARRKLFVYRDRRPELYGLIAEV